MSIHSLQNKAVKEVNSLKTIKGRKKCKMFILEGLKPVQEALQLGLGCRLIICPETLGHKINDIKNFNGERLEVSKEVFEKLTSLENPEGVLLVLPIREQQLSQINPQKPILILDRVSDPGNLGTLMRSADAFGFHQIILMNGSADPFSPKAARSSMGSILRVQCVKSNEDDVIDFFRESNICPIGLDANGCDVLQDLKKNTAVVLGSESHGISSRIKSEIKSFVKIEMEPGIESLNASIAGSIIMQQIYSRRNGVV